MKLEFLKGNNIIGLEKRRMDSVFPAVNEVDAYWSALASDQTATSGDRARTQGVPTRASIDPRGIEGALAQAFILERIARSVARFRLAGSHLADLMGMEVRGMPLTAMFLPDSRAAAGEALERGFSHPAKVILTLAGERGVGRAPLDARMILLPLRDEEGRITRLLGALEAKGQIGRQPRRFGIVETRFADLGAGPDGALRTEPVPGFAEPQPAACDYHHLPGRPALRVIRNDAV